MLLKIICLASCVVVLTCPSPHVWASVVKPGAPLGGQSDTIEPVAKSAPAPKSAAPDDELDKKEPAGRAVKYKLPSWFSFETYKRFYGKNYPNADEAEMRKRLYLKTALRVLQQRALYRINRTNTLASTNELSDYTTGELETIQARHEDSDTLRQVEQSSLTLPNCCTFEQVYTRVINLLDRTSVFDPLLNAALLDELEQKSLMTPVELPASEQLDLDEAEYVKGEALLAARPPPPPLKSLMSSLKQPAQVPSMASMPSMPSMPSIPSMPSMPSIPSMPSLPVAPRPIQFKDLPESMSSAIRQQVQEQFSTNSTIGRALASRFSAMVGEPVVVKASIVDQPKTAVNKTANGTGPLL